jgi:phosphoesterase RecJ-like protein
MLCRLPLLKIIMQSTTELLSQTWEKVNPELLLPPEDLKQIQKLLESPAKITITTHHKPDADALGSSLALALYLRKKGHEAYVVTPSDYPSFLNWMPGESSVMAYDPEKPSDHLKALFLESDMLFCLDFNSLNRINDLGKWVEESPAVKFMIDHHLQPDDFARFKIWNTGAAATAELIFEFITILGDHRLIDLSIAECLYAGLVTDTGSFRHPSTNRTVHLIVADLLRTGVDPSRIHKLVYDNNNLNRLRFLGFVLKDKLVVLPEFHTAYIAITKDEINEYKVDTGDTEGIVNYALSIRGMVLGIVVIDRKDQVKMSFRSLGEFNVNTFARKYFEGGGHKNAAGGKSMLSLTATVDRLLHSLEENKQDLMHSYQQYEKNTLSSIN